MPSKTKGTLRLVLLNQRTSLCYRGKVPFRRRIYTEDKAKAVAAVLGTEFLAAQTIFHQDDLKKRMYRIMATCQNRCFGKKDDHPVHTWFVNVLPITFVQNILAAQWLVRNSSTSPNQQRRPLPSLLSLYFFYGGCWIEEKGDLVPTWHKLPLRVQITVNKHSSTEDSR